MSTVAEQQAANYLPPVKGEVLTFTATTTGRSYDLKAIALSGHTPNGTMDTNHTVNLTLHANGGDVFFVFSADNTASLTATAAIAESGTVAFASTYAMRLASGGTAAVRISRNAKHRYLHIISASGSPLLHVYPSSESLS